MFSEVQSLILGTTLLTIFVGCSSQNSTTLFHRIAVGSCFNANRGDRILHLINQFHPDQFISLGDLIYADFHPKYNWKQRSNPQIIYDEYYKVTQSLPIWQQMFLSPSNTIKDKESNELLTSYSPSKFLITLDDHDYGTNNGDKTFQYRNESIDLFYKFFPHMSRFIEVVDSSTGEIMMQEKEGVFSSHTFKLPINHEINLTDDEGTIAFTYKVVLLDGRSNKDKSHTKDGDFLGQQQWQWLEKELHPNNNREVDLILVGSAIQVLVNDKLIEENWGEFPNQRKRLLSLISKLSVYNNVVILSGDIHTAEVSQARCPIYKTGKIDFYFIDYIEFRLTFVVDFICKSLDGEFFGHVPLIELTSSGLSHTFSKVTGPILSTDSYNSKIVVNQKSRGFYIEILAEVYQLTYPGHFREKRNADTYGGLHFALLDIVLVADGTFQLVMNIVNHAGEVVIHRTIPLPNKRVVKPTISFDELATGECEPYWGVVPYYKYLIFRSSMVIYGMIFVLLPLCVVLWLVFASIYYICFGKEIKRRDMLLRRYERKHGVRASGEKIKVP